MRLSNQTTAEIKLQMSRDYLFDALKAWRNGVVVPELENEYKAIQTLDALLKEMQTAR